MATRLAVVADEVRNLVQRYAQAALDTTGLIEDLVAEAKEGTDVAGEVGKPTDRHKLIAATEAHLRGELAAYSTGCP